MPLVRLLRAFILLSAVLLPAQIRAQSQQTNHVNPKTENELKVLKSGTTCERRAAILALHDAGKDAIAILIQRIGDSDIAESSAGLFDIPILSYRPPDADHDYFAGALYAYSVELILGRAKLKASGEPCDFLLDTGDYVYQFGLIRKENRRLVGANDLTRVKERYVEWWQANRNKTLAQLRSDWKRSVRPLKGSQFRWE